MVTFDVIGNPTPYSIFTESISDFEMQFLFNEKRKEIYGYFDEYSKDLKRVVGEDEFEQWVDGSFTTKENNPNDIDVLSIIPHHCQSGKTGLFFKFTPQDGVKDTYGKLVDAYLVFRYPEGDKRNELEGGLIKHFQRVFASDRNNNPKGIICLKR